MTYKTLFIIRHGETDFNLKNIVQGSGVDTSLNETGKKQAEAFYHFYKHHPFDVLYTSALRRTHESVAGFIQSGIPHHVVPELNEISWGDFEGKQQSESQKAAYFDLISRWNSGDIHAKIPNGESPFELYTRQQRALQKIISNPNENEVLVCMHGRAMKSFLCLLLNEPLTRMEQFPHQNLCLYKVRYHYDSAQFQLELHNDTSHLQPIP